MIDTAFIDVEAGDGGNGIVAFRHEALLPMGGPAGGNGGDGGSVVLKADASMNTLLHFRRRRMFRAESGAPGGQSNRRGKSGDSVDVAVPVGTEVWKVSSSGAETMLGDLSESGMTLVVAKGGTGGVGNASFTSSINQEPLLAESGDSGQRARLRLDLKLLGDVGLVGMPNAGKSSILAAISAARPKIADYPFTTIEPVLGVVQRQIDAFVVVDIPGLLEGAHEGIGLGDEFLKHIQRTRVLVHVVDGSEPEVMERIETINRELESYDPRLPERPQIIAINKLDMSEAQAQRSEVERRVREALSGGRYWNEAPVIFVSAATHEGLDVLVDEMRRVLATVPAQEGREPSTAPIEEIPVLRPTPKRAPIPVVVEGDGAFRIVHPRAVRLAQGSNLDDWATRVQYQAKLGQLSVTQALVRAGIKQGDTVIVADWEFDWD